MREVLGWLATIAVPPFAYWVAYHQGLSTQAAVFVGIITAVILLWVFALVDDYIPPLLGMSAAFFFQLGTYLGGTVRHGLAESADFAWGVCVSHDHCIVWLEPKGGALVAA